MHVRILLQITVDDGTPDPADEIAAFEKTVEQPEDLGLSLAEGENHRRAPNGGSASV
jgi:hypothetical protein